MAHICLISTVAKTWLNAVSGLKAFLKVQNTQKCENPTFLIFLIGK
jgi:hypothetical protein